MTNTGFKTYILQVLFYKSKMKTMLISTTILALVLVLVTSDDSAEKGHCCWGDCGCCDTKINGCCSVNCHGETVHCCDAKEEAVKVEGNKSD